MSQRSGEAILVIAASLIVFAILAALPFWTASRLVKGDRVSAIAYEGGPLWEADLIKDTWAREQNWVQAGFFTTAVTLAGLITYRRRVAKLHPDQSDDYEEKADGSIPDGRAPAGDAPRTA
jgi:hypothetical protein